MMMFFLRVLNDESTEEVYEKRTEEEAVTGREKRERKETSSKVSIEEEITSFPYFIPIDFWYFICYRNQNKKKR